jgi:hypothetical protein
VIDFSKVIESLKAKYFAEFQVVYFDIYLFTAEHAETFLQHFIEFLRSNLKESKTFQLNSECKNSTKL